MSENFPQTYAAMSDDALLNIAIQAEQLLPEARSALIDELRRRNLSQSDVSAYAEHLNDYIQRAAETVPASRSFRGFGTRFHGKRDFRSDGSFVSTKWVIIFWIPVVPVTSARVSLDCDLPWWGEFFAAFHSVVVPQSYIIERFPAVDRRQVVSVYSFLGALFVALSLFRVVVSGPRSAPPILVALGILLLLFVPYMSRRSARRQVTSEDATT